MEDTKPAQVTAQVTPKTRKDCRAAAEILSDMIPGRVVAMKSCYEHAMANYLEWVKKLPIDQKLKLAEGLWQTRAGGETVN